MRFITRVGLPTLASSLVFVTLDHIDLISPEMSIKKLMLISLSGKTDNDHITIYKQFYECLIKRVCKQGIDDYITFHPEETLQEPIVITTKFLFIAQNFEASSLSLKLDSAVFSC